MNAGGVVLCGGSSRRMGRDKGALPFGGEPLVRRVARRLGQAVRPVVVAAAPGQQLPPLPPQTLLVRDARAGRGPLEGLRAGLAALEGEAEAAFVVGCDAPLLQPAFVRRLIDLLGGGQAAAPWDGRRLYPLAAVYRLDALPCIQRRLAADRLRLVDLLEELDTRRVPLDRLREADPQLLSLVNVNDEPTYAEALRLAAGDRPCP